MLKKILVPLDGSAISERILSHVEKILMAADVHVGLAHVCSRVPRALRVGWAYLHGVQGRVAERFASIDSVLLHGAVARSLIHHALMEDYGLIALTTHARSGLSRAVYGSTATELMRASPVPLYLARPETPPARLRRILVPLDGSERALAILPVVGDLARAAAAKVTLMTALPEDGPEEGAAEGLAQAQKALERQGVRAGIALRRGTPVEEILSACRGEGSDLVAIATHGRSGLDRLRFGSVAEAVLRRSPVPVLIRRTAGMARKHRLAQRTKSLAKIADFGEWL